MKDIAMPGYETILSNEFYGKEGEPIKVSQEEELPTTDLLCLNRVRIPSKERMINFLLRSARISFPHMLSGIMPGQGRVPQYWLTVPPLEIGKLADGNEKSIAHLRRHCPGEHLEVGSIYLETVLGTVDSKLFDLAEGRSRPEKSGIYRRALASKSKDKWNLDIRLTEGGILPPREELERLLGAGTIRSDVISAQDYGDYGNIVEHVRLLSGALVYPAQVGKIPDKSHEYMEEHATAFLRDFGLCVAEREMSKLGISPGQDVLISRAAKGIAEYLGRGSRR